MDIVYLNGTTDYVELWGYVDSGDAVINVKNMNTYLSAILVSGGSASGGGSVVDQKWQDVTSDRVSGATYTNDTGRAIQGYLYGKGSSAENRVRITVDGLTFNSSGVGSGSIDASIEVTIPNGSEYIYTAPNGITSAYELREPL